MTKRLYFEVLLTLIFVTISILSFFSKIHFGGGLGDIIYCITALGAAVTYVVISIMFRKSDKKTFLVVQAIFLLILIYFVYSFTIGRGPESSWDGTIFF